MKVVGGRRVEEREVKSADGADRADAERFESRVPRDAVEHQAERLDGRAASPHRLVLRPGRQQRAARPVRLLHAVPDPLLHVRQAAGPDAQRVVRAARAVVPMRCRIHTHRLVLMCMRGVLTGTRVIQHSVDPLPLMRREVGRVAGHSINEMVSMSLRRYHEEKRQRNGHLARRPPTQRLSLRAFRAPPRLRLCVRKSRGVVFRGSRRQETSWHFDGTPLR